jgi:peptide-methionine (S)-S-oxide reductase
MSAHSAYFATGCFWGAERRFWKLDGVIETSVGYMGGTVANPSYESVCTGRTGHTETVKVVFDPSKISYARLLKEFWEMHDPTTLDRQGNDIGSQYRSAIFTTSDQQNKDVEQSMAIYQAELDKSSIGPIVTQVLTADQNEYFEAEKYHQRYLEKNPNGYDCHSNTGVYFPESMVIA